MNFSPRQHEIIEAGSSLIHEGGIQNVTIKNLSQKIGISEPALYRHFKNKTDILSSMLAYFREKMTGKMSEILNAETKAIDKIKAVIDFQFKLFTTDPSIVMIIFSETSFQYENSLSEEVYEIIKHKKALMESIVHKGQMEGSIRKDLPKDQLATIIMGSMRMTVLRWRLSNFAFNLNKEGKRLTNTLQILLQGK